MVKPCHLQSACQSILGRDTEPPVTLGALTIIKLVLNYDFIAFLNVSDNKKTNKQKFFFLFFSLLWFCLCVFGFFCFHSLL